MIRTSVIMYQNRDTRMGSITERFRKKTRHFQNTIHINIHIILNHASLSIYTGFGDRLKSIDIKDIMTVYKNISFCACSLS